MKNSEKQHNKPKTNLNVSKKLNYSKIDKYNTKNVYINTFIHIHKINKYIFRFKINNNIAKHK